LQRSNCPLAGVTTAATPDIKGDSDSFASQVGAGMDLALRKVC